MKSNKKIVESLNSFIEDQFIKRNTEGKIFEEHSIICMSEQREKWKCTFD